MLEPAPRAPPARGGGRRASSRRRPPCRSAGSPTVVASPAANERGWRSRMSPIVAEHAREAEQHRQARGDERAEREQQDDSVIGSDEYSARWKSLPIVSSEHVLRARLPELLDAGSSGCAFCTPATASSTGCDLVHRLARVAADLELHDRGVAVLRDLPRVARGERRADVRHDGLARDRPQRVVDRRAERLVVHARRLRLDEDALAGAAARSPRSRGSSPPSWCPRTRCRRP